MNVSIYLAISTIAFTALGTVLGGVTSAILHVFGWNPKSSLQMGVWTLPNALVLDLFLINLIVIPLVWPLLGASYMYFVSSPPRPWEWLMRVFDSSTLFRSEPFIGKSFSAAAIETMLIRSVLLALASFTFIVMPTCAWVTVARELRLFSVSAKTIPLSCQAMWPDDLLDNVTSADGEIFEALCWPYWTTLIFSSAWASGLTFLICLIGTTAVMVQQATAHPHSE